MKDPLEIKIPATQAVTDQYRLDQSSEAMAKEEAKPMTFGTNNLESSIFKRGQELNRNHSFALDLGGEYGGAGRIDFHLFPSEMVDRVNRDFSLYGIAATIALTDTAAGVREVITYDENEQIVLDFLNGEEPSNDTKE